MTVFPYFCLTSVTPLYVFTRSTIAYQATTTNLHIILQAFAPSQRAPRYNQKDRLFVIAQIRACYSNNNASWRNFRVLLRVDLLLEMQLVALITHNQHRTMHQELNPYFPHLQRYHIMTVLELEVFYRFRICLQALWPEGMFHQGHPSILDYLRFPKIFPAIPPRTGIPKSPPHLQMLRMAGR